MSFYEEQIRTQSGGINDVIDYWWSKKSIDIRSSVPAKVLEVDYEKSSVKVQPLIKVFFNRDQSSVLPEAVNVPLVIVSGKNGTAGLKIPIGVGDIGILTYADQDTSDWLSSDGKQVITAPSSTAARENLSTGAYCYVLSFEVGIYTRQAPLPIDPNNVVLFNNTGMSIYYPDGKLEHRNTKGGFTLNADGSHELTDGGGGNLSLGNGTNTLTNGKSLIEQAGAETLINKCIFTELGNIVTPTGTDLDELKRVVDNLIGIVNGLSTNYNLHKHYGGTEAEGLTGGIVV